MILVFALLLAVATFLALRREEGRGFDVDGAGWRWFVAWSVSGVALTFSLLTGLSIGLFFLPLAASLLLWVASRAPHPLDAFGFVEGIGAVLVLVAFLNRAGTGVDPMPWLFAGLSMNAFALLAYSLLRRRLRVGA
jgi:hypothetical protein